MQMRLPDKYPVSFRHLYFLCLKKSKLTSVASPLHPTSNMQSEKYCASEHQRRAPDHKTNGHPAQTRDHHDQKTVAVLAADEINSGQSANGRQPVDAEKLHKRRRTAFQAVHS